MVQIVGKFECEKSEGFEEYLKTVGAAVGPAAASAVGTFVQSKPVLEIRTENANRWIISVHNEGKSATSTFDLGLPYDETMPHGMVLKSVTTQEGNKFITHTELPGGNKSIRIYEFNDSGIVVHLSDEKTGAKAKRFYKRL